MKSDSKLLNISLAIVFVSALCIACKKDTGNPEVPGNTPQGKKNADTISQHFRFAKATKKQGNAPSGPAASQLQISVQDTIRLAGSLISPVKFLHMDTTQNVSGVWIQIGAGVSGGFATHYYEVPEVADMEDYDTVSAIIIGMDPEGLQLPQTFEVRVVPYDKNKQSLGDKIIPVKLDNPKTDLPGNNNSCGIALTAGEHWSWDLTIIPELDASLNFAFYNEPGKKFSSSGADIEGSCCNGNSHWPDFCQGEIQHNRTLHFGTYYTIKYENFAFLNNGNFSRSTLEDSPVPFPAGSDFCSGGAGIVLESLKMTDYSGTWEVRPVSIPANAPGYLKHATHELRLTTTNSNGTGYGNPGGIIHQLDCEIGSLVLAQITGENASRPLVKFYSRHQNGKPKWYHFL